MKKVTDRKALAGLGVWLVIIGFGMCWYFYGFILMFILVLILCGHSLYIDNND